MKHLEQLSRRLNALLMILGGVAALLLMLLAAGNVLFRIIGRPLSGTYELVGFLGALVVAFALGHTQWRKDHIEVDVLTRHFPGRVKQLIDVAKSVALLVFFAIVARQLVVYALILMRTGEVS